ncbi:hypothetical protein DAEQUDRAFT_728429 [Daedalea quercina L-15889]|uniref:DUF6533 domain-containing protein n=1 Tax=Daedalea quercina L-15889 TaxID=1314783 RepID=A0A165P9F2_9APHY|nr:hypothetical protein DAEQUDRAFT_728429 [Daedalea quercina L-15889]
MTINELSVLDYLENYINSNHCVAVATVLIIYDYLITLDDEISLLWLAQKKRASTLLFAGSRFTLLVLALAYIACCWQTANKTVESCMAVAIATACVEALAFGIIASASALRVGAISGGKWSLAAVAFVLGLVPAAMNILISLKTTYTIVAYGDLSICVGSCNGTIDKVHKIVEIITRTTSIASDMVVIAATWYYCYNPALLRLRVRSESLSLVGYTLQDGTIYFIAILTLNIINLFTWFFARWTSINMIVLPVSAILVSRSIINLRQMAYNFVVPEDQSVDQSRFSAGLSTNMSSLIFADSAPFESMCCGD